MSWFQIGLKNSHFIPVLAKVLTYQNLINEKIKLIQYDIIYSKFDYVFHHSKTNYVVMNKWLSPNEPKNIPVYAFTNVGVGKISLEATNDS